MASTQMPRFWVPVLIPDMVKKIVCKLMAHLVRDYETVFTGWWLVSSAMVCT